MLGVVTKGEGTFSLEAKSPSIKSRIFPGTSSSQEGKLATLTCLWMSYLCRSPGGILTVGETP